MASFLAGQRLPAGALNAFTDLAVDVTSGPTSGTTPLVVGTLVIPAAPIDRMVASYCNLRVNISDVDAAYSVDVLSTGSLRRGYDRVERDNTAANIVNIIGKGFLLSAGATTTLTAVLTRISGTGTASIDAGAGWSYLGARFSAAS